jgi:hypothetical protein
MAAGKRLTTARTAICPCFSSQKQLQAASGSPTALRRPTATPLYWVSSDACPFPRRRLGGVCPATGASPGRAVQQRLGRAGSLAMVLPCSVWAPLAALSWIPAAGSWNRPSRFWENLARPYRLYLRGLRLSTSVSVVNIMDKCEPPYLVTMCRVFPPDRDSRGAPSVAPPLPTRPIASDKPGSSVTEGGP